MDSSVNGIIHIGLFQLVCAIDRILQTGNGLSTLENKVSRKILGKMWKKNMGVEKSSQREASHCVVFKRYYQNDQIKEDELRKTGTDEKVIRHLGRT
jgi:hypothetical protein